MELRRWMLVHKAHVRRAHSAIPRVSGGPRPPGIGPGKPNNVSLSNKFIKQGLFSCDVRHTTESDRGRSLLALRASRAWP